MDMTWLLITQPLWTSNGEDYFLNEKESTEPLSGQLECTKVMNMTWVLITRPHRTPNNEDYFVNKKRSIEALAAQLECTKVEALEFYEAYHAILAEALINEGEATLHGIGTLRIKDRAERTGRNPRTGEPLLISARKVVNFKAAVALNTQLNA